MSEEKLTLRSTAKHGDASDLLAIVENESDAYFNDTELMSLVDKRLADILKEEAKKKRKVSPESILCGMAVAHRTSYVNALKKQGIDSVLTTLQAVVRAPLTFSDEYHKSYPIVCVCCGDEWIENRGVAKPKWYRDSCLSRGFDDQAAHQLPFFCDICIGVNLPSEFPDITQSWGHPFKNMSSCDQRDVIKVDFPSTGNRYWYVPGLTITRKRAEIFNAKRKEALIKLDLAKQRHKSSSSGAKKKKKKNLSRDTTVASAVWPRVAPQQEINNIRKQLEDETAQSEQAQSDLNAANVRLAESKNYVENFPAQNAKLEEQLKQQAHSASDQREKELQEENLGLKQEVSRLKTDWDFETRRFRKELEDAQQRETDLKEAAQQRESDLKEAAQQRESRLKEAAQKLAKVAKQREARLEAEIQELKETIQLRENQLRDAKQHAVELQHKNRQLENDIQKLHAQREANVHAQREALQNELQRHRLQVRAEERNIKLLEGRVADRKENVTITRKRYKDAVGEESAHRKRQKTSHEDDSDSDSE